MKLLNPAVLAALLFCSGTALAEETPVVDPRCQEVLEKAGAHLAAAKQFSFRADVTVDEVLVTGQKIQRSAITQVGVRRPDRLMVDNYADRYHRRFYYNGHTLTLFDVSQSLYATANVPATIDETIRWALDNLKLSMPLAEFLASKPGQALREGAASGMYIGLNRLGSAACHHLAFSQDKIDWQIWVDAGATPLIRKIVITYKTRPGSPQFSAVFRDWDLAAKFDDGHFMFEAPRGASKIDFLSQGGAK